MPDLEAQIAGWRRQMIAAGIETPVPLDELESHLREDIERRMKAGADVLDAFEVAAQRLGEAAVLELEFKNVGATERKRMKRITAILASLFGMVFGASMVLPQLGQWSRTGVMRSLTFLLLGVALVLVGGSAAFYGIRTHRELRGRKLISVGIVAAGSFYLMPFIFAFFQSREMDLRGWIFCAALSVVSLLFFGSCFYSNRHSPPQPVHER